MRIPIWLVVRVVLVMNGDIVNPRELAYRPLAGVEDYPLTRRIRSGLWILLMEKIKYFVGSWKKEK